MKKSLILFTVLIAVLALAAATDNTDNGTLGDGLATEVIQGNGLLASDVIVKN